MQRSHADFSPYGAKQGRENNPTPFPESSRVVADHALDILVEAIGTVEPGDADAFEEEQD